MKYIFTTILFILFIKVSSGQDLLKKHKDLPCVNKVYSLFLHVPVDTNYNLNFSLAGFQGAVEGANKVFEPICISFNVCEMFVINNYNFDSIGTDREYAEFPRAFYEQNRINIYIMESHFDDSFCGVGGGNSIVLLKSCLSALTHELGHVFSLPHTFSGSGEENVDGSNCETAGDGICDTPADPFVPEDDMSEYVNGDCEFISLKTDANGEYYQPDVGNIMSYYPCTCGLTYGQYIKMANFANNANPKMW